jgi:soluble lytic murein transglycosylase-like protein
MRFCLKHKSVLRCAGLAAVFAGISGAAMVAVPAPRIRSVVRADANGRLVRRVIVIASPQQAADSNDPAISAVAGLPELVEATAKRFDVDPLLVHSVIQVESNYNPYAVSAKGAQGLMQLMPSTARRFGVKNTFDVKQNIEGGVRYLKYLDSLFPNDRRLTIAAYNAGEGAVWKYGNNVPPYRETEQYVQRVGMRYGKARRAAEKEHKRQSPVIETAQTAKPSEPEVTYAPVQAFVDAEGRLYLRTVPVADRSERNP